jgi:hypothetical protein
VLVAGYIFKADNPTQTIADLKIDNDIKKKPALTYLQAGIFISAPLIYLKDSFAIAIVNA